MIAAALLSVCLAVGQPPQARAQNNPQPPTAAQARPVPIAFLYWAFLNHQNQLDAAAAAAEAQGKDGNWLRGHLQASLGFSDADYAVIRTSSSRLAPKIKALDAQAATIRATGISPSNQSQLNAFAAQRKAYIDAEIAFLKQSLPPSKIAAFETFLRQFFPQSHAGGQTNPSPGQSSPSAVQP
jgi:hypothetical protein